MKQGAADSTTGYDRLIKISQQAGAGDGLASKLTTKIVEV
jgi:hypothetical protein